jgi:hypothetical protein
MAVEQIVSRDQADERAAKLEELRKLRDMFRKPTGPVADRIKELERYE